MTRLQAAEQFRKAMQLFAATLSDEQAAAVATVYGSWKAGAAYEAGTLLAFGENAVGDPQLYRVLQTHTAQEDWLPSSTSSLYTPIGLNADGIPLWSQPVGAHDAYAAGDTVDFHGTVYRSRIDGNVYSPDAYAEYWEAVTGGSA